MRQHNTVQKYQRLLWQHGEATSLPGFTGRRKQAFALLITANIKEPNESGQVEVIILFRKFLDSFFENLYCNPDLQNVLLAWFPYITFHAIILRMESSGEGLMKHHISQNKGSFSYSQILPYYFVKWLTTFFPHKIEYFRYSADRYP